MARRNPFSQLFFLVCNVQRNGPSSHRRQHAFCWTTDPAFLQVRRRLSILLFAFFILLMDEWTIKTPNPKCRLFYKIELFMDFAALCWTYFMYWRYIHSWLVYSTQLVKCCPHGQRNYTCILYCCPSTFSLTSPPSPPLSILNVHTNSVWLGGEGWGGCWIVLLTMFCRSFTLIFWPDSEPTKVLHLPQQKWPVKTTFRGWCL